MAKESLKKKLDIFMNEIPHSEIVYQYDSIYKSLCHYKIFLCVGLNKEIKE